jgi:serine/threonine-protein kinase HipA
MSIPEVFVHIDLGGETYLVGRLWVRSNRRGQLTATFRYADSWSSHPLRFAVDPLLDPATGPTFHNNRLFGAIADSAPERWGRTLMAREERRRAKLEGRTARTLTEIDYALGVSDLTRQGALRFSEVEGREFLAKPDEAAIPPILELPRLMAAAQGFLDDPDNEDDLRILLAPGSSLGGARPKASVVAPDGRLSIAKFPKKDDTHSVNAWEQLAIDLAHDAGIRTAESRLLDIENRQVILLPRFDRDGESRIPFLSAMSMVDAVDQEARSYLEIAEVLRRFGSSTRDDLRELFRRIVFNVLVSNTDDHLRNHGFLYAGRGGWALSPAYDLNPMPAELKSRFLSTAIGEDPNDASASLDIAMEVTRYFDLERDEAREIVSEVAAVTSTWAVRARSNGIAREEIVLMASAFEHEELKLAQSFQV